MEWKRLPNNAELLKFAGYMEEVHVDHSVHRKFVKDADFLGPLCERRWHWAAGTDMNTQRLGGRGDGGKDGIAHMKDGRKFPLNCKCARYPKEIIVPVENMDDITEPTIFILGRLINWGTKECQTDPLIWDAKLLVWQWSTVLRKSIPKYHTKECTTLNYWAPAKIGTLEERESGEPICSRDIYELLALVDRRWGRGA